MSVERERQRNWHDRIRIAKEPHKGHSLSTQEIIEIVRSNFKGANVGNVLPGDHCLAPHAKNPCDYCQDQKITIFTKIQRNKYLVIGQLDFSMRAQDIEKIFNRKDINKTTKNLLVDARLGQGKFRTGVMRSWKSECAVTGCDQSEVLRASHMKPWHVSNDAERLDPRNGLLLSANIDALFDSGLVSFEINGKMLISQKMAPKIQGLLGLPGRLRRPLNDTEVEFLNFHRAHVFSP